MSVISDFPRRLIRFAVDSIESTIRPFRFSFARSSSFVAQLPPAMSAISAFRDLEALDEVLLAGADVEADEARVRVLGGEAVDRVRHSPFSRISWNSRDDAEPPRIASRSEAANLRRSERAIPGAATQTWYCSVSFRAKRMPGGGCFTSGDRTPAAAGRRVGQLRLGRGEECEQAFVLEVAGGARTMFPGPNIVRWYAAIERRLIDEITSARPITGRPSAWPPKTASESRSWTSSCGVSSYIAISSSTTSRSASSSANRGAKTMSVITSSAVSRCWSGTRA